MGLGLLISTIAHTQGQALLTAFLWTMLEAILSGQILPVENMPQTMQWLAQATPATHFTDIIRGVMLRGDAIGALWPQVGALTLIGMALYGFAATRLKKRLD
jgi:ABC-2 type transport system permease protein